METYRKKIKKLLVDLDLEKYGSHQKIVEKISTPEDPIHINSLRMALTGQRQSERSIEILRKIEQTFLP